MPVIKRHENLADFVSSYLGTMNALFDVANKNGASITDDHTGGEELALVPFSMLPVVPAVYVAPYLPLTRAVVLKKHQNNTDFVCQHFGTVEALFALAALNNISITEQPEPGTLLNAKTVNEKTVAYFIKSQDDIVSDSAISVDGLPPLFGGIGFMKVRGVKIKTNDFITS
jgi:hypothetical protein